MANLEMISESTTTSKVNDSVIDLCACSSDAATTNESRRFERQLSNQIDEKLKADHKRLRSNSDSALTQTSHCVMNCFPSRAKRYIRHSIERLCIGRRAWTTEDLEEYTNQERKASKVIGERLCDVGQVIRTPKLSMML